MSKKQIIVVGDVCVDWLSVPLEPRRTGPDGTSPQNWQLRGGKRMHARHGGAWLTTHFVRCAVGTEADVFGPTLRSQEEIESVSPERMIHSLVLLDRCPRPGRNPSVLGVVAFDGFAGPGSIENLESVSLDPTAPQQADVIVLDDAGNGFRDDPAQWQDLLSRSRTAVILHKLRRPLSGGRLGGFLRSEGLLPRTIALLNVDELRAESEGSITRGLSWERTATETVDALYRSPQLAGLRDFGHLVIPLGLEGVLHVDGTKGQRGFATLWYCADKIEGDRVAESKGTMTGFASAFAGALAAEIARAHTADGVTAELIGRGIAAGVRSSWQLFDAGFGPCPANAPPPEPQFPGTEIYAEPDRAAAIHSATLNPYPSPLDLSRVGELESDEERRELLAGHERDFAEFRAWSILRTKLELPLAQVAENVVRSGPDDKTLHAIPMAKFGALELIDRVEIESYRTIRNLIREFLHVPRPERPLCLAVFGAPGAGKSFGVVQVAKSIAQHSTAADIEKHTFNVSQWQTPDDLARALHRVRDSGLRNNIPLVFFDEFDSPYQHESLGWLKYFLAPMQDGVFNDGAFTHVIGRAIFVFAGGTKFSFAEFQKSALADDSRMKAAKAPDFLSRLRGYVDVQGVGAPVGVQILRRALLLRSFIGRKCPAIIDDKTGTARVSSSVCRAFLNVAEYRHGTRSIEAVLDMSALDGAAEFTASLLPPAGQLQLHAPQSDFVRLLNVNLDLGEHIEQLARASHEAFVASQTGKRDPDHPSMQPWEQLIPLYKNSNREQAAHVPVKLAAIGCTMRPAKRTAGQPPDRSGDFDFAPAELEQLARMEHDRWMEERRPVQPDHPALVPWERLSDEDKEKDRDSVRHLPAQLREVGLEIVRLS